MHKNQNAKLNIHEFTLENDPLPAQMFMTYKRLVLQLITILFYN